MKIRMLAAVCPLLLTIVPVATAQVPTVGNRSSALTSTSVALAAYGKVPLSFAANQGQSDSQVKFLSKGDGYSLFLTDSAALLALTGTAPAARKPESAAPGHDPIRRNTDAVPMLRMEVAGAAHGVKVTGEERLPGTANYFIGQEPAKWNVNVPTYAKVKYSKIYPGVDLVYYGNQRQLEYDFVVAPGADAKPVHLHFKGVQKLRLSTDGDLAVKAGNGNLTLHKPVIYQIKDGRRQLVAGGFRLLANNNVSFRLGSYDHARELVIDPTLSYSTYLGGGSATVGSAIAVDSTGNAYVAGYAFGPGLPVTKGAIQGSPHSGTLTAFVSKLNPAGDALLYSTYLGGSNYDFANSIAVDSAGDAFVTGAATSTNFPITSGAYQKANKGASLGVYNAFLAKLNPTGTGLVYSTYLGGTGTQYESGLNEIYAGDQATAVAIDKSGDAYLTGVAYSFDFPVSKNAFQTVNNEQPGSACVFVTRFNATGSALIYSTYLGGSYYLGEDSKLMMRARPDSIKRVASGIVAYGDEYPNPQTFGDNGYGIAVDSTDNAYVAGFAQTFDFPTTPGAYQENIGEAASGAFVTKLNPAGSALIYSTTLAGSCYDGATAIAIDGADEAYITGAASSYDFPTTPGAFQRINKANPASAGCQSFDGIYNAFVSRFNAAGSALVFSTLLGGSVGDQAQGIVLDTPGNSYVTGYAGSPDFPLTADALQRVNTTSSGFLSAINTTGSALLYSTFVGGMGEAYSGASSNIASGIAIDKANGIYITGQTSSTSYPVTSKPLQAALQNENYNAFVSKFAFSTEGISTSLVLTSNENPQLPGKPLTITVQVKPVSGKGVPTGTVSGSVNGSGLLTERLDANGSATFLNEDSPSGIYNIVATYSGDSLYAPTSGDFRQVVSGGAGSIAPYISCGATYGAVNQCELVAVVDDAFGAPLPGAVVQFSSSGLRFANARVTTNASGLATVMATALRSGQLVADATVEGLSYPAVFNVTATPAVLTVKATNITVPYNQPIPALSYSVTGFVNGDKSSVVTGTAGETTSATQGSPAGTYPITLTHGSLSAKNYTFKLENGTLTITSAQ